MDRQEIISKIAKKLLDNSPSLTGSYIEDLVQIDFLSDGSFRYIVNNQPIHFARSKASVADGRTIDTRSAKQKEILSDTRKNGRVIYATYEENGLRLVQHFELLSGKPFFVLSCYVEDLRHKTTESNYIAPLVFGYPDENCNPLFRSLDQKMLLVPYDNDMWVRYESAPLRPGRTSYDITAIYDEKTNNGLIIGALDFTEWKNAVQCSSTDARCYTAFSGIADAGTHDCMPHGTLIGDTVTSSRFMCGWYDDIRFGLEEYGRVCMEGKPSFSWNGPVPFGWNSFAGVSFEMPLIQHWKEASRFIKEETPNFCDNNGVTYINLDANFFLSKKELRNAIKEMHERGQKAGSYMAPLISHSLLGMIPLRGSAGKTMKSIAMKDSEGKTFPAVDGSVPVDITLPAAEKNLRLWIQELVDDGFDYIKIDFLSHGAVEGPRHDKNVRTGRQALSRIYDILREELDPEKIGREIFVDLSIAPLFPAGGGHARRCCCDAFGHHEDVRYVLNALNFGWWTSGTLYRFADPDHTVLYHAFPDKREATDLNSARSRFLASAISGTVMLLSDNYGPTGEETDVQNAKERAVELANNPEINRIARIGTAFRPLELKSDTADLYYLHHDGSIYVAVFNFDSQDKEMMIPVEKIGAPRAGNVSHLWSGKSEIYDGKLSVKMQGYDCDLLKFNI